MNKILIFLALAVAACSAAHVRKAAAPSCVLSRTCAHSDWRQGSRAHAGDALTFHFAVKNANMDKLDAFLATSHTAERWMTRDEVIALTLDVEAVKSVRMWMQEAGFQHIELNEAGFLTGMVSCGAAEKMFNTEFYRFVSPRTGRHIARALEYSLPEEIASLLDFVDGTVQFPMTLRQLPVVNAAAATNNDTTLSVIDATYSISKNTVKSTQATQSLFETLGQSYSPDDLAKFEKQYNVPSQDCVQVIGTNTPADCKTNANNCAEANLDVQYIIAVAQSAPTTYWSIAKIYDYSDPFLEWALEVEKQTNPPYVHSISYGGDETANDASNVQRTDEEITKLVARGLTVMVSSGDDGVAGSGARSSSAACGFAPTYPGQLPHIVSVGATMGPEYNSAEVACTANNGGVITTGGGFSTLFTVPDWQSNFTSSYIKSGPNMPPSNKYNGAGRAYPDVAMMGHNYMVAIGGRFYEVSGTSASAPVFAAVVTLANAERLAAGKKTLGWLTPDLYSIYSSHPDAFIDVTSGTNNCAAQGSIKTICCTYGFTCAQGWDPVTGLGSVNYSKLLPYLLNL